MRNKFLSLTAVQLKGVLMTNQFTGGSKKQKKGKIAAVAAMFVLVAFIFIFYCALLTYSYISMGLTEAIMPMLMAAASIFIIMTTLFKANGFLFAAKDDDLLMSLPVKTSNIILSRFTSLYIFEAATTAMIIVPSLIVWLSCLGFDAAVLIKGLLSVLFIPMIPLAAASLLGIIITYIAARFKYKNLVMTVLGMACLLAIMYFSFNAGSMDASDFSEINTALLSLIVSVYPPAKLFALGMNGNILAYIGLIVLSAAVFAAVTAIITVNFKKITTMLMSHHTKSNYKMGALKTSGILKSLIGREFKHYFSMSGYVMNTGFSLILMPVAAVAVFFIKDIDTLLNIPGASSQIGILLPVVCLFFTSLSSTTFPSVSLEGSSIWLTASLPVHFKTIYLSKILMNLILSVPACLISTILFVIRFKPDTVFAAVTILLPTACAVFMAFFGLAVNLKFPNFEWTNATTVIKQSAGGFICSFGGLIITFGSGALVLMTGLPAPAIYAALFIIFAAGTALSWYIAAKTPLTALISR